MATGRNGAVCREGQKMGAPGSGLVTRSVLPEERATLRTARPATQPKPGMQPQTLARRDSSMPPKPREQDPTTCHAPTSRMGKVFLGALSSATPSFEDHAPLTAQHKAPKGSTRMQAMFVNKAQPDSGDITCHSRSISGQPRKAGHISETNTPRLRTSHARPPGTNRDSARAHTPDCEVFSLSSQNANFSAAANAVTLPFNKSRAGIDNERLAPAARTAEEQRVAKAEAAAVCLAPKKARGAKEQRVAARFEEKACIAAKEERAAATEQARSAEEQRVAKAEAEAVRLATEKARIAAKEEKAAAAEQTRTAEEQQTARAEAEAVRFATEKARCAKEQCATTAAEKKAKAETETAWFCAEKVRVAEEQLCAAAAEKEAVRPAAEKAHSAEEQGAAAAAVKKAKAEAKTVPCARNIGNQATNNGHTPFNTYCTDGRPQPWSLGVNFLVTHRRWLRWHLIRRATATASILKQLRTFWWHTLLLPARVATAAKGGGQRDQLRGSKPKAQKLTWREQQRSDCVQSTSLSPNNPRSAHSKVSRWPTWTWKVSGDRGENFVTGALRVQQAMPKQSKVGAILRAAEATQRAVDKQKQEAEIAQRAAEGKIPIGLARKQMEQEAREKQEAQKAEAAAGQKAARDHSSLKERELRNKVTELQNFFKTLHVSNQKGKTVQSKDLVTEEKAANVWKIARDEKVTASNKANVMAKVTVSTMAMVANGTKFKESSNKAFTAFMHAASLPTTTPSKNIEIVVTMKDPTQRIPPNLITTFCNQMMLENKDDRTAPLSKDIFESPGQPGKGFYVGQGIVKIHPSEITEKLREAIDQGSTTVHMKQGEEPYEVQVTVNTQHSVYIKPNERTYLAIVAKKLDLPTAVFENGIAYQIQQIIKEKNPELEHPVMSVVLTLTRKGNMGRQLLSPAALGATAASAQGAGPMVRVNLTGEAAKETLEAAAKAGELVLMWGEPTQEQEMTLAKTVKFDLAFTQRKQYSLNEAKFVVEKKMEKLLQEAENCFLTMQENAEKVMRSDLPREKISETRTALEKCFSHGFWPYRDTAYGKAIGDLAEEFVKLPTRMNDQEGEDFITKIEQKKTNIEKNMAAIPTTATFAFIDFSTSPSKISLRNLAANPEQWAREQGILVTTAVYVETRSKEQAPGKGQTAGVLVATFQDTQLWERCEPRVKGAKAPIFIRLKTTTKSSGEQEEPRVQIKLLEKVACKDEGLRGAVETMVKRYLDADRGIWIPGNFQCDGQTCTLEWDPKAETLETVFPAVDTFDLKDEGDESHISNLGNRLASEQEPGSMLDGDAVNSVLLAAIYHLCRKGKAETVYHRTEREGVALLILDRKVAEEVQGEMKWLEATEIGSSVEDQIHNVLQNRFKEKVEMAARNGGVWATHTEVDCLAGAGSNGDEEMQQPEEVPRLWRTIIQHPWATKGDKGPQELNNLIRQKTLAAKDNMAGVVLFPTNFFWQPQIERFSISPKTRIPDPSWELTETQKRKVFEDVLQPRAVQDMGDELAGNAFWVSAQQRAGQAAVLNLEQCEIQWTTNLATSVDEHIITREKEHAILQKGSYFAALLKEYCDMKKAIALSAAGHDAFLVILPPPIVWGTPPADPIENMWGAPNSEVMLDCVFDYEIPMFGQNTIVSLNKAALKTCKKALRAFLDDGLLVVTNATLKEGARGPEITKQEERAGRMLSRCVGATAPIVHPLLQTRDVLTDASNVIRCKPDLQMKEIETAEGPCVLAGARYPKNASPSVVQVYTAWDQDERFFTEWNPLELSLEQYLKKKQQKRDAPDISEAVPNEKEQRSEGDDEVMRDDISWEDIEGPEDAGAGEENPAANGEGEASQKRHKKK